MILISPAKTLDFSTPMPPYQSSEPRFMPQTTKLIEQMQGYTAAQLADMMQISPALARLNYERFAKWNEPETKENKRAAIFAYNGPVYDGLSAYNLPDDALLRTQQQLRIVSGLYGLLRPFDLIQAYRLEMATTLDTDAGSNLYQYWGQSLSKCIIDDMAQTNDTMLINLASDEYSKAILNKQFPHRVITPQFKDLKDGKYKMITIYAKRCRGLMARYILQNNISNIDDMLQFNLEGYSYSEKHSNTDTLVFIR